jgi:hypothetical protein
MAFSMRFWNTWTRRCGFMWISPESRGQRRYKTSVDWMRQMTQQVRRWLPECRLLLEVDGSFAAMSLALAWVKSQAIMVSRLYWDAALPPDG